MKNEGKKNKPQRTRRTQRKNILNTLCPPLSTLCLLIICFTVSTAWAQSETAEPQTAAVRISLDDAVELALKNNLSLESARISLSTKQRASSYSWNQFIPNITATGAFSMDIPRSTVSGTIPVDMNVVSPLIPPNTIYGVVPYSTDGPQYIFAIPINVSLNFSMAMIENMKRLRLDYETGLIGYDKARLQLERDVRKAYHSMLLLQENIDLLRVNFSNVERQVQMAQANYNAGLAPELTLLQARVARENMKPMIDQAESGLKLSMAQFAMFLGLPVNTEFELVPITDNIEINSMDLDEMASKAASQKPEVREMIQTIRMLRSVRMAQVYSLTPILSVGWGTTPAYIGNPANSWRTPFSSSLTISLTFRLHSLIPYSSDFQGIKAIEDQIRTAEIGLTQLVNGTEIEIYNIVLALEKTKLSASAQREAVNLAEQAYRLTEQAYRAGLQDYFQVQNAQASLHQARVQMLEQQFNYLNSIIDLEYAIGVPFGTLTQRSEQ